MLPPALPERPALRLGTAALAGAAGVLCFQPFGLFWLAPLVCLLLFTLLRQADGPRTAAWLGFAFGLGFFLVGVSWIYVSLSVFGGMPVWLAAPATFLFCALLAAFYGAIGWACRRWLPERHLFQALWFAALVGLADWSRSWVFTGFPWLAWGYSQSPPSPLAGFAPLVGVFGLSLAVALAGALLGRWRSGLAVTVLLFGAGGALQRVAWTEPAGEPLTVALIQGNVGQEMKWRPEQFFRTLALYRDLVEKHPARLVVLPETAVPAFLDAVPPEFLADLQALARRNRGDLLFGTVTGSGERYWNSAVSLGTAPTQVYNKSHLVPFGEFIPAGFSWFLEWATIPMSQFARGEQPQAALEIAGRRVAPNICYEDVFGDEIIRALPAAGLLVNLSNTAWYGRSFAQPQHLQIAQLRALETGRPMLRATNTGMTAVVAPDGTVQASLPAFTQAVLTAEVRAYQGMTPFARWGNGGFLALALVALAASRRFGRR